LAAPTFRDLAGANEPALATQLQRPEVREKILSELTGGPDIFSRYPYAFELSDPPRYDQDPDESLAARASAAEVPVIRIAYDILAADGIIYVPVSNYVEGNLRAAHEMLLHPCTVPGLSDGGAHCTNVADFDYPTFLLSHWAREAPADQRIPVERVVKLQCADTANLVGLHDRGVLARGKRADVNLIDLSAVGSTFPTIVNDLPGGGSRLVSRGTGYVATIVGGQVCFEDGLHTGAMAGGLVRGGTL
jgi:N-acyl-D-aspartate/D-glutamate deacylase